MPFEWKRNLSPLSSAPGESIQTFLASPPPLVRELFRPPLFCRTAALNPPQVASFFAPGFAAPYKAKEACGVLFFAVSCPVHRRFSLFVRNAGGHRASGSTWILSSVQFPHRFRLWEIRYSHFFPFRGLLFLRIRRPFKSLRIRILIVFTTFCLWGFFIKPDAAGVVLPVPFFFALCLARASDREASRSDPSLPFSCASIGSAAITFPLLRSFYGVSFSHALPSNGASPSHTYFFPIESG